MQVDINIASVLGYGFLALMSVITYLLKQAVDGLKAQIDQLHEKDDELAKEIHSLDKNSITREEIRGLFKEHSDYFEKSLSAIFRKLDNFENKRG